MFYQPGVTPHDLPHDPFKSCVIPRPIGWISTISPGGTHNLGPYSQFTNLSFDPPLVMFSANQTIDEGRKDTTVNAELTGRFCWNMATWDLREAVNASAEPVPYEVDEFKRAGVTPVKSELLGDCPMVKESPIKFECVYHSTLRLPGNPPVGTVDVVIGRVVGVHIADGALTADGRVDVLKIKPIARCGYFDYTVITELFSMKIPGGDKINAGLEGSAATMAKLRLENEEKKAKEQAAKDAVHK